MNFIPSRILGHATAREITPEEMDAVGGGRDIAGPCIDTISVYPDRPMDEMVTDDPE